jgi:hypothetical protein
MDHGPIKGIRALYWLQYIFIHNVDLCTKVWALYGGFWQVHTLGLPYEAVSQGMLFT